jgi:DNA mismatch repair ATPase MutS
VTLRRLLEIHASLDAWKSMATANKTLKLHFPSFEGSQHPLLEIRDLKHIMLKEAVGYDLLMDKDQHFIFLTGANMAGKSTLIKAVGLSVSHFLKNHLYDCVCVCLCVCLWRSECV